MVMDTLDLAIKGYTAYGEKANWKNYQGLPMPTWDALPPAIQESWKAAAEAIAKVVSGLAL